MPDKDLVGKVADIPLTKPGFGALGITAPIMIQVNPSGKWATSPPDSMDEDKLKKIVNYLIKSKAISAAQSYCCQCHDENEKNDGEKSNKCVPIIMMPILSADQCPFDLDCETIKKTEEETEQPIKKKNVKTEETEKDTKKKRGFVMQRLTDFDLLSQW